MNRISFLCLLVSSILFNNVESKLTISGISSGGFMAVQFQVAYSYSVSGAGIMAGGPYWCAQTDVAIALTSCSQDPSTIIIEELILATHAARATFSIDSPSYISNHKVWLFSGNKDTVVDPGVMKKLMDYYLNWVNPDQIQSHFEVPAQHAFPTLNYGNPCSYLGEDFINNCHFDAAGDLLNHLHGPLKPQVNWSSQNFIKLDQSKFINIPLYSLYDAGLGQSAFAYVPSQCKNSPQTANCSIHVSFHGCEQYISKIGDKYYTKTGYNGWAEANNIIILYPQANTNVLNPKGCWDWWGYTGADYATKLGVQMGTVKGMVDFLSQKFKVPIP
eukprot:TRINITY_DN3703_c0_g1_i1.p1 TRINITY_DN3703_c0_g1~~TRINITY_DN3703_c0_g1_i1.p1  ORF type:complete len:331 (+),score=85.78 TRINITY_DN3703_c0_g1_i1:160-1152(+)